MERIPSCFYRVSVKALVLNESRDRFLIMQEHDGKWDLPGGGLEYGVAAHDELRREIDEEMGLPVTWIATHPAYFVTSLSASSANWVANILYETELAHLDFTPSDECMKLAFVNGSMLEGLRVCPNVTQLTALFDPLRHRERGE